METAKEKKKVGSKEDQFGKELNNFFINYFTWLMVALVIIILGIGYFFIIQPKYKKIVREVEAKNEEMDAEYNSRQKYFTKIKNLKIIYQGIEDSDKNKINKIVPDSAETETLMTTIELMVVKNGLILSSLTIEPEEIKVQSKSSRSLASSGKSDKDKISELPSGVGTIKIFMDIVGVDYDSLKNIIRTIENNLRLMNIIKIDYDVDGGKASFEIVTYYLQ